MPKNYFTDIITAEFKQLHEDAITELITACSIECKLIYGQTLFEDCPNCIFDIANNRSSNRYQAGGSTPFNGICPICFGRGKFPNEQSALIDLAVIYDYKEWIPVGIEVGSPLGLIQTISLVGAMDKLKQAKEIIVDTSLDASVRQRFERHGEPQPCGFAKSTIIATIWKRIEN